MKREKRPTVEQVAEIAGVSLGTVSNVLNGVIPVREKTRQKVLEAIQELDYRQNMLAQGLRAKRAPIVGLCVPHTSITYFAKLVDAFEDVASTHNVVMMQVLSRQDPEQEYSKVRSLLNYRISGLLLVPTASPEKTYEMIQRSGAASVIVDRAPEGEFLLDNVSFDNRSAMWEVGSGLIERGHRHILFICHQRLLNVTVQRTEGLKKAAEAATEKVRMTVIECHERSSMTAQLAIELGRVGRPTAIIVSNSKLAVWLYRSLRALNVRCPDDVSVVAFDEPEWADIVTPSLSVVRQPTEEIATMAWRFLLSRINDEATETQSVRLRAETVWRESVAAAPPGVKA